MKETYREINPSRYLPTEEELVCGVFAELLEQNESLCEWFGKYSALPATILMRYYYDQAGLRPQDREPAQPPDESWRPDAVQIILAYGATRSGKTNGALYKTFKDMCEVPGLRVLGMRHTYDEINDTIFGDAKRFASTHAIDNTTTEDPPQLALPNDSLLMFRSTKRDEKPGQDKSSSLQGMEFGACILEEADRIPEYVLDTVITRLSQSGLVRPWILIICNPPGKNHWIYNRFFRPDPTTGKMRPNHHAIFYPLKDNAHNLRPGYVEDLQRELISSPSRYQRFFEGRFTQPITGKALFKKYFRYDTHVIENLHPIPGHPLWVGFDFGYVHPAVVVCQEDPETLQVKVLWEYMGNETMLEEFVQDVKRRIASRFKGFETIFFVDPHGRARNEHTGKSSIGILRDMGIHPFFKDTDVTVGLSILATMMYTYAHEVVPAQPMLMLNSTCVELIDGFTFGYTQDPRKHTDGSDDELSPYKDGYYEHLMDALRYVIVCNRHTGKSRKPSGRRSGPKGLWTNEGVEEHKMYDGYRIVETEEFKPEERPYYGFGGDETV